MRDFNAVLVFLNSRMAAGSGYFFQHSNVQSDFFLIPTFNLPVIQKKIIIA
jgi:hypothetical protein